MNAILSKVILFFILLFPFVPRATAQSDTSKTLEEVTVSTGQYKPQSLKNSVFKIKVISREQIKAKAALNLTQVLNTELGIRFSNDNALGVTNIQLMGMTGRSIKILLDGVPMTDRNDTRESLNQIDIQSIERIEIVEGPMSVIYGSDALAGVINIITQNVGQTKFNVGARVQEETVGKEYNLLGNKGQHLQSINAAFSKNSIFSKLSFTHSDFEGFGGDPHGRAKSWKPKDQYLGSATVGRRGAKNLIYYRLDMSDETITSKGAINLDIYKAFDQKFITKRWMHQLQDDWHVAPNLYLNTTASYTDYSRRTHSTRHDFTTGTDELTTGKSEQDIARFSTLFFRTQGFYIVNEKLSFQPGIEINHNAASGARIEGSPQIIDFSFFASAEWKPVSAINIRPGFRVIKNSLYDAPPIVPALNAKIGLSQNIDLRLSLAQGYRAPALRELYFDFVDANHAILGNKNLKAEKSKSANASLTWHNAQDKVKTTATLSGFYNVFDDLIDYAQDPQDPTLTKLFNVDKFKTTGISYEQNLLLGQWQFNIGAIYIGRYNRLSNSTEQGIDVPRFNWSPEASSNIFYNIKRIDTRLAFLYKFNGARKTYQLVNSGGEKVRLTQLDSYNWADFTATKNLFKAKLSVQAGVKNIFDINNVNNSSGGDGAHSTGGPTPISYGRSYFIGLAYQFSKN